MAINNNFFLKLTYLKYHGAESFMNIENDENFIVKKKTDKKIPKPKIKPLW